MFPMKHPAQFRQEEHAKSKGIGRPGATVGTGVRPSVAGEGTDAMQRRLLSEAVRSALVEVVFLDIHIGIADANEVESGQPVSLSANTQGIELAELQVGTRLLAKITRFNHAVSVEPA